MVWEYVSTPDGLLHQKHCMDGDAHQEHQYKPAKACMQNNLEIKNVHPKPSKRPSNMDTSSLEIIELASVTHGLVRSPKLFMHVRSDVPRDMRVQLEHTGANRWSDPGPLCKHSKRASLGVEGLNIVIRQVALVPVLSRYPSMVNQKAQKMPHDGQLYEMLYSPYQHPQRIPPSCTSWKLHRGP